MVRNSVSYASLTKPFKDINKAMLQLKLNIETYGLGNNMHGWLFDLTPKIRAFQDSYTIEAQKWAQARKKSIDRRAKERKQKRKEAQAKAKEGKRVRMPGKRGS